MIDKKIITIGIVAVVALAVFYLGNLVMKTTPPGDAGGTYQYKIVSVSPEGLQKIVSATIARGFTGLLGGDLKAVEDVRKAQEEATLIIEKTINNAAKDGWEYVGTLGSDGTMFVFRKK